MPQIRIHLLGSPEVESKGNSIDIKRRKDLALLSYLAVNFHGHRREALAAIFWSEHEPSKAFSNLRRSIWELKQIFGEDLLEAGRDTVALRSSPEVWVDVAEFRSLLSSQTAFTHPSDRLQALIDAVSLYQDDFMIGFTLPDCPDFDEWQYFTANELRRELGAALETLADEFAQTRNFERAIHYAQRWLSRDALNEAAHRLLMTLFAWSGERVAAIRQYQECVRILQDELGLPPEDDTKRLFKRIQSGRIEKKRPSKDELLAPISNLPIPPTPFVGRREELDQIHEFLLDPDCRLLTLLGPGGIGKTRLAIQAAEENLEHFPNGVYFIPLLEIGVCQAIFPAIAGALHFSFSTQGVSPEEQLLGYLHRKRLLLIFDNFEHLVSGAEKIAEIIAHVMGVKILTTSREKLGLQSEWVYEVHGLPFPKRSDLEIEASAQSISQETLIEGYAAMHLFAQSAERIHTSYRITPENIPSIARISQLVDGIPLALELAASWVPVLGVQEIADEIERGLGLLETNFQDVPERQRSMRAVFDHSWRLLSERERESLARLSVFRGGFTHRAVLDIYGISPNELRDMIGKSLLARTAQGRFEINELLRQYASEKLAQNSSDNKQAHDLHSAYFCNAIMVWKQSIYPTQKQPQIMEELNEDNDNALAAWYWALENQQIEFLNQAIETLALFYWRRVRFAEGISLFNRSSQALIDYTIPQVRQLLARLLAWEGIFHLSLRDHETSEGLFLEALSILEEADINQVATSEERALAHWGLGQVALQVGDSERSQTHLMTSIKLYQKLEKPYYEAEVLHNIAELNAYFIWDAEKAEVYWGNALEIKRTLGDQFGVATILHNLGIIAAYHIGDIEKAINHFQESSDILQGFDDRASKTLCLYSQHHIAALNANTQEMFEQLMESLPRYEEIGDRYNLARMKNLLGSVYLMRGNYIQAEAYSHEGLRLLRAIPEGNVNKIEVRWGLGQSLIVQKKVLEAKQIIEENMIYTRKIVAKHGLGVDLAMISLAEFLLEDRESAWKHIMEAIGHLLNYRHYQFMLKVLSTLAILLADQGDTENALTLYGLITCYPEASTSQWFKDIYWRHIHKAAADTPPDKVEEAIAHGRQLDIWEYTQGLLGELKSRLA